MLRTGRMISASAGSDGSVVEAPGAAAPGVGPVLSGNEPWSSSSATGVPRFLQCDHDATVIGGALDAAVASGGQPYPALETALRQLEAMDDGRPHFRGEDPVSRKHEVAPVDDGFDLLGIDPGEGDE